jgi:NADH dehydrogenase
VRGHIQVRVAEVDERVTTLVTLEGHPLAGAVRFLTEARGDDVRFEIQVFERAAGVLDFLMMRTLGERLQDASWREMAEKAVKASGGAAPAGVQLETENLDEEQAELIEEWLRELVMERKRDEAGV